MPVRSNRGSGNGLVNRLAWHCNAMGLAGHGAERIGFFGDAAGGWRRS
ncbi:hypothetical protein IMCC9480_2420 [Oxalobacteraceae bacterium IMCC9480]|nr:hypothetical protein IMCC9480_2420 [Oxalobacteraceae bacterium IMCC9480]